MLNAMPSLQILAEKKSITVILNTIKGKVTVCKHCIPYP